MRTLRITTAVAVIAAAGVGLWMYRRADARETPAYRLAAVQRASITSTVTATGTLGAVRTVEVGTQASGQIAALYADFNDHVKKGQLVARIDPTLQQQAVQDAEAGLQKAQAQLTLAKDEYDRNKQLFDEKIITASEWGTVASNYTVAQTAVKSAQINLDRARQNLAYTEIFSPIDGVVVERNVDVGQTVAASLSAPKLFTIAQDLSRMQILASVDESDIGLIHEGQRATFTVQSYPNQTFTGTVGQVRLNSTTQNNVVNYTAVVNVENTGGKLLPGMTATVKFVTGSADSVLTVPNAALRFQPAPEQLAEAGINPAARDSTTRGRGAGAPGGAGGAPNGGISGGFSGQRGAGGAGGAGFGGGQRPASAGARTGGFGRLWYLDAKGKLAMARVRTGLTDGQRTQVESKDVTDGMSVIIGTSTGTTAAAATTTNPLQQQQGQRRGPPGAF